MDPTTENFKTNVRKAIADNNLSIALSKLSEGFPAKRRGLGLHTPSTRTVGFSVLLAAVAGGSYLFYTRRSLRDALAEEEDDSE